MGKEQFLCWKENGGKIFEYTYKIESGEENLRERECEINAIYEDGFETFGFGYHVPFDCFGEWKMQRESSNSYEYYIFLTCGDNIEDYLVEIKTHIAERIQKEIKDLQKSLVLLVQ